MPKAHYARNPEVPKGPRCKTFGSFTLAGEDEYPKTFLLKGQPCFGLKILSSDYEQSERIGRQPLVSG